MDEINKQPVYQKVLVVDDNEVDRYIASRNISKCNFAREVVLMESAVKALQYLESLISTPDQLPDLIFLDIRMPELDGFGFLERYEKLPEAVKNSCIVMMLTTSLNPLDQERASTNKYIRRFVVKPLDKERLIEIIAPVAVPKAD